MSKREAEKNRRRKYITEFQPQRNREEGQPTARRGRNEIS
jgi:hypothetical protein